MAPATDTTRDPVRAVRALLGTLGAPAVMDSLALEQALTATLAVLTQAPFAVTFDPLARSPAAPGQPVRAGRSMAQGPRRGVPAAPLSPSQSAGTVPAVGAVALHAVEQSLMEIKGPWARSGATSPDLHRAARPPGTGTATRLPGLAVTRALSEASGGAAQALASGAGTVPGAGVAAPALAQIASLSNGLWWQIATAPGTSVPASSGAGEPAKSLPRQRQRQTTATPQARTQARRVGANQTAAAASASSSQSADGGETALSTLDTIARLTTDIFAGSAPGRARTMEAESPVASPRTPAPRAPSVLAPARGERAMPPAAGGGTSLDGSPGAASTAVAPPASVNAATGPDALARALRAEGHLRGVDLP